MLRLLKDNGGSVKDLSNIPVQGAVWLKRIPMTHEARITSEVGF